MKSLKQYKETQMKNPEFAKEYESIQPEMDVIRAIIEARTSQNITQKELAERTGINQADISKLENGTRNPSVKRAPQSGRPFLFLLFQKFFYNGYEYSGTFPEDIFIHIEFWIMMSHICSFGRVRGA